MISVDGIRVCADPSVVSKGIQKALYREDYELSERILISKALVPGDRVLEIGAGIGLVSLICARICGPGAVLSYEPNSRAAEAIRLNFRLNGIEPNLRVRAVTSSGGVTNLFINENIFSSSLFQRDSASVARVEADSISCVLGEFEPNVIVMDAEGIETELLPQVANSAVRKVIVELHPHIVGENAISSVLGSLASGGFMIKEKLGKVAWFERPPDVAAETRS